MDGLYAASEFKVELIVRIRGHRDIGYGDKQQKFVDDYFSSIKVVSKDYHMSIAQCEVTDMEDLE